MTKKRSKKKMERVEPTDENTTVDINDDSLPVIDIDKEVESNEVEVTEDEEIKIKAVKPVKEKKPVMPPYSEIFIIKDLGNEKLVIKKDGTKIYIPK